MRIGISLFTPFFILSSIQCIGLLFYEGFLISLSGHDILLLLSFYFSATLATVIFCCIKSESTMPPQKGVTCSRRNFHAMLMIFLSVIFLIRPTIIMLMIGNEIGFDLLRVEFFNNYDIRYRIYGSLLVEWFINQYFVFFVWFYVIVISTSRDKMMLWTFYFLLIVLVLYNMAYAGRFNIYYAIIVLYMRNVLSGYSLINFIKKNLPLTLGLVGLSFFVLSIRNTDDSSSVLNEMLIVFEYHIVPPFYLIERINDGMLFSESSSFPFKTIVTSILMPVFYLFDIGASDIPWFQYGGYFNEFSVFSVFSEKYYNAFSTLFSFFYIDFGYLSPFFCFSTLLIFLLFSLVVDDKRIRISYLSFIALMLYMSLFKPVFFSPGFMTVLFVVPAFYLFRKCIKKI